MCRLPMPALAAVAVAMALAGCGSHGQAATGAPTSTEAPKTTSNAALPKAHPQAIEPTAGVGAGSAGASDATGAPGTAVGDVNDHAPPLSEIKRELKQLNLCGGVTNSADAAPVVQGAGPGFTPDPGTSQFQGQLPQLTGQLNALGEALGATIYGISGYRTPAQSVAVGGFANDPHTQGKAEDIGVNSLLRSSAARISEAQLAQFGLYRPFDPSDDPNNAEVNHVQLIPAGGPLSLAQSTAAWDPDPRCR
jgi:Peptidase M15